MLHAGHLIGQFHRSEIVIDRNFERVSAPGSSSIFGLPDDVTLVSVDLIDIGPGPGISHRKSDTRAAIDVDNQRDTSFQDGIQRVESTGRTAEFRPPP